MVQWRDSETQAAEKKFRSNSSLNLILSELGFSASSAISPAPLSFSNKVHLCLNLPRVAFYCLQHWLQVNSILFVDSVLGPYSGCSTEKSNLLLVSRWKGGELLTFWDSHLTWRLFSSVLEPLKNLVAGVHANFLLPHTPQRSKIEIYL